MCAKKKIMVVDDDQDFVKSVTLILEASGYETVDAESGERCLEILRYNIPDLIILDIMMKTITEGFSIISELKASPRYQCIPVIMVSSIKDSEGFRFDDSGIAANDFIDKPFDPQILLEHIRKHIG